MRITKDLGLFRQTEEYEYTPSIEELFYYYSGTHAGYNRDNPYALQRGTMTKRKLTKVSDLQPSDSEASKDNHESAPVRRLKGE